MNNGERGKESAHHSGSARTWANAVASTPGTSQPLDYPSISESYTRRSSLGANFTTQLRATAAPWHPAAAAAAPPAAARRLSWSHPNGHDSTSGSTRNSAPKIQNFEAAGPSFASVANRPRSIAIPRAAVPVTRANTRANTDARAGDEPRPSQRQAEQSYTDGGGADGGFSAIDRRSALGDRESSASSSKSRGLGAASNQPHDPADDLVHEHSDGPVQGFRPVLPAADEHQHNYRFRGDV